MPTADRSVFNVLFEVIWEVWRGFRACLSDYILVPFSLSYLALETSEYELIVLPKDQNRD